MSSMANSVSGLYRVRDSAELEDVRVQGAAVAALNDGRQLREVAHGDKVLACKPG